MKNHPQPTVSQSGLTCIEICSGAGGQAIGLERAGFEALAHVEFDRHACETLRLNRPDWNVVEGDVRDFSAYPLGTVPNGTGLSQEGRDGFPVGFISGSLRFQAARERVGHVLR